MWVVRIDNFGKSFYELLNKESLNIFQNVSYLQKG